MKKILLVFCLSLLLNFNAFAESHHPEAWLAQIKDTPDEGTQIVEHFCATCHAPKPQIELGAPKIHSEADWKGRLKLGINSLLANTINGIGAMPPRGGCFECSDEQLNLAISAMLPISKQFVQRP